MKYVYAFTFIKRSIGRSIRRGRLKRGWNQAELARRAKVRIETISRLERGVNSPTVRTVEKIEKALRE